MTTAVDISCNGCRTAKKRSQIIQRWVRCNDCGQEYLAGPDAVLEPKEQKKPRRNRGDRARGSSDEKKVRLYVQDVLEWDKACSKIERVAKGAASPIISVIAALERGVVGHGCYGTKGVLVGHSNEIDVAANVDPLGTARYLALRGNARSTTNAVLSDGQGEQMGDVTCGNRTVSCSLAQRVGMRLSNQKTRQRWYKAIADGDSIDAMNAAGDLGDSLLKEAAEAWFSV